MGLCAVIAGAGSAACSRSGPGVPGLPAGGRPAPDAGAAGATEPAGSRFACDGSAVRLEVEHLAQAPQDGSLWNADYRWTADGDRMLISNQGELSQLSLDGRATPVGAWDRVAALSPLATSALASDQDGFVHVARDGATLARLGPHADGSDEGILRIRFSEDASALIADKGWRGLEREATVAIELRAPDGSLIARREDFEHLRRAEDGLLVGASGDQVVGLDPVAGERWRVTYRARVGSLDVSRNGKSVAVSSSSISFQEDADNSELLIVDGVPHAVPFGWVSALSPDGRWFATALTGSVDLYRDGQPWGTRDAGPGFLADAVDVDARGSLLVSGTTEQELADGGVAYTGEAFLYDAAGERLAHCVAAELPFLVHSAFARDGARFALFGGFGVLVYALEPP